MKKVELLAPVGSFKGLLAVINAGADAVYLSGKKFTARAYAANFDDEELIEAIETAHLFGKKVYLTLNTLVKESELCDIEPYVKPLYLAGLDGVIVQDLGAVYRLHNAFPKLEIHASTQMSIVGPYAASLLKEYGITRIVPAREISLEEIKNIKNSVDIEIEAFIHGAMCYAYSGQCLFSSILGGRSGNRGRCAQPCRLPYRKSGSEEGIYPLSMKDMCTLPIVSELIDAGIDSFKIEGRMKKPVYAAGVTSIYRKYIDKYYAGESTDISEEDFDILKNLYLRSDISEGYYHRHNGKDMITISSPAYKESDEEILKDIEERYVLPTPKLDIDIYGQFTVNEQCFITVTYGEHSVSEYGMMVSEAKNAPVSSERIKEQLLKTGDTYFNVENISIYCDDGIFIPMKALNELRRNALLKLKEQIINGI